MLLNISSNSYPVIVKSVSAYLIIIVFVSDVGSTLYENAAKEDYIYNVEKENIINLNFNRLCTKLSLEKSSLETTIMHLTKR